MGKNNYLLCAFILFNAYCCVDVRPRVMTDTKSSEDTTIVSESVGRSVSEDFIREEEDTFPEGIRIEYKSFYDFSSTYFSLGRFEDGYVTENTGMGQKQRHLSLRHYKDRIMQDVTDMFITKSTPIIKDSVYTGEAVSHYGSELNLTIIYRDSIVEMKLHNSKYGIPGYETEWSDSFKSFYNLIETIHEYVVYGESGRDGSF